MGWIVSSPENHLWEAHPPVAQNVTLFGDQVFKEVSKLS